MQCIFTGAEALREAHFFDLSGAQRVKEIKARKLFKSSVRMFPPIIEFDDVNR